MSKFTIAYPPGATPLDPDEMNGLIPDYISTQGELNQLEKQNITEAMNWLHKKTHEDILNVSFLFELHKKMFGDVWKWAGQKRNTDKNIGVNHEQIITKLATLIDDTKYWIENNTYSMEEIAIRFHHKLVSIHAFPNGNGRHARLMTDILLEINGEEKFSWGMNSSDVPIEVEGPIRECYVATLKEADKGNCEPLLDFAKS